MKTKTTYRILPGTIALLLALLSAPVQLGATTANATLNLSLTVYDNAVSGVTDGTGDGNQANASSFSVGELDDASNNRLERGILTFSLPSIPGGEELVSATLKLYVRGSGVSGDASVYHSQTLAPVSGSNSLYENSGYSSFTGSIATPSTGGTSGTPVLATLNVTQWILSDYQLDGGSVISSFRIQIDGLVFTENNTNNRYSFVGKNTSSPNVAYDLLVPVLELQYASAIPEPGTTGVLAGVFGLMFALCVRRRVRV